MFRGTVVNPTGVRGATQHRLAGERVDHPEDDVRAGVGLHIDGDAPRLAARVQDANLQVRVDWLSSRLYRSGLPLSAP